MNNNTARKIAKAADGLMRVYGFSTMTLAGDGPHAYALVTMDDNAVIRVNRIPNTTRTAEAHVAQNILKAARMAHRQGMTLCCYPGGK